MGKKCAFCVKKYVLQHILQSGVVRTHGDFSASDADAGIGGVDYAELSGGYALYAFLALYVGRA